MLWAFLMMMNLKLYWQSQINSSRMELNEANVQAIFNRCLATKDTPNADVQLSILFKKVHGI